MITNDNFSDRFPLVGNLVTTTVDTTGFTGEIGEPIHGDEAAPLASAWWSWTAPQTGLFLFNTVGSDIPTNLGLYQGLTLNNLLTIAQSSHNPFFFFQSQILLTLQQGETYQIAVDGYENAAGPVVLSIDYFVPPPNDDFADRIQLTGDSVSADGYTPGATIEPGEPAHFWEDDGESFNSVWWTWTAPSDGVVVLQVDDYRFPALLAVYTGEDLNQLQRFSVDSQLTTQELVVTAGTEYQIAVDGFAARHGRFQLNLEFSPFTAPVIDPAAGYGFERNDFTNWTAIGSTNVVTEFLSVLPSQGTYQALLATDTEAVSRSSLTAFLELPSDALNNFSEQIFSGGNVIGTAEIREGSAIKTAPITVKAGEVLTFDWNFFNEEILSIEPANDFAFVTIGAGIIKELADGDNSYPQDTFPPSTGYRRFEYKFSTAGTYEIGVGVVDVFGSDRDAFLLVDDLKVLQEILGTSGHDNLNGSSASELIKGLQGNDRINGNGGTDDLLGGDGNDVITGASNDDYLDGGKGNDTLYGNGGRDYLVGGEGNDSLLGGSQSDTILGGKGNDTIYGNGGHDFINSGSGRDRLWLGAGQAQVVLEGGSGYDVITNFQLGSTRLVVDEFVNLSFITRSTGVEVIDDGDLLAVVSSQTASTFAANIDSIFIFI